MNLIAVQWFCTLVSSHHRASSRFRWRSTCRFLRFEPDRLALGDKPKFVSATGGDTPFMRVPIRILGMDTPELHYAVQAIGDLRD